MLFTSALSLYRSPTNPGRRGVGHHPAATGMKARKPVISDEQQRRLAEADFAKLPRP